MSTLKFFSRVAFICNVCFLFAVILLWVDHPPEGELISLIIVMGFVLAVIINSLVNISIGVSMAMKMKARNFIPGWLIIANFLFLIPQLILLLK
jgi:hypothetical protein